MKTNTREKQEWITMRWHDNNTPSELPHILLIGDSIVNGHISILHSKLKNKYTVDSYTTSKLVSDKDFMSDMQFMFAKRKYEIIIFNNGLHGIDIDDEIYATELFNILSELKNYTHKLIWRNSTPCYPHADGKENPWTEKVKIRNMLAETEVRKLNIPTIDCYSVLKDKPELVSDGVHFHTEGYEIIANTISSYLK